VCFHGQEMSKTKDNILLLYFEQIIKHCVTYLSLQLFCYRLRMPGGTVFGRVCLSVCLSVCPVCALICESLDPETSFLVCRYIVTICGSHSYVKVIRSRSRSQKQTVGYVSLTKYTHLQVVRLRLNVRQVHVDVSKFVCCSPFPETGLSFSTLFCRAVNVSTSRLALRLRDFPQDLLSVDDLRVRGRLIGAEPVGIDRGLSAVLDYQLRILYFFASGS